MSEQFGPNTERNRCPMCGLEFNEIQEIQQCPHCCGSSTGEELIGEWDNCGWDY